ncbi:MAG: ATP-binding protein [Chitinispirillia bacterium]|nr:ATP-binding protein [Chitinispirillia bacterium]MCL2241966.1 ATP-binding protein [Chitinispirillia bacterium]MCL2242611.1 ATP-binding protein [Chitinispirillia bacterium]
MTETAQAGGNIPVEAFETLRQAFEDFQARSDQLERAYLSMQDDFKKVNLELERKNAELESSLAKREALERQLQQASAMAALGEMSATVAHEIRNPLGAMGIWAGLLERDLDAQDPRRKTLGKITDGLAKLNKIVTNLLVYTRPIATDFRKVRLSALLEEIVDFTEIEIGRLGRNITVEKKFGDAGGLYVMADPEKINQATINICLNAVQAMEDGGTLSVGIEKDSAEDGKYVIFTIADTGPGIDREHLDKIFVPFFTTKEDGTGLGLAIVKKIIEFHGGRIDIKSELGVGTQVSCYLPSVQG